MIRKPAGREDGFSLLELTAVLAIYGLLSVVSLQVLTGALGNSGRAAAAGQQAVELTAALSVMRRDLEAMAPVADPGPAFRVAKDGALSFTREIAIDDAAPSLAQIVWRLDPTTGDLSRFIGSAPEDGQTMLSGVAGLVVRVTAEADRWMPGDAWSGVSSVDLPRGIEVVFTAADLGDVRLIVVR